MKRYVILKSWVAVFCLLFSSYAAIAVFHGSTIDKKIESTVSLV